MKQVKFLITYAIGYLKLVAKNAVAWVRKNPARSISYLTAAVVFVCARLGVVVDQQTIGEAVALVLPILAGGEATHKLVSPA